MIADLHVEVFLCSAIFGFNDFDSSVIRRKFEERSTVSRTTLQQLNSDAVH